MKEDVGFVNRFRKSHRQLSACCKIYLEMNARIALRSFSGHPSNQTTKGCLTLYSKERTNIIRGELQGGITG